MPLTAEEKQNIRDDEYFRSELRKEFSASKPPPTFGTKLAGFFETKVGFWLLTTVLAGAVGVGFTYLQKYLARQEIAQQAQADAARRDADTIIKLAPMLVSGKLPEAKIAVVLLNNLGAKAGVSTAIANDIRALFEDTATNGAKPSASIEERQVAEEIAAKVDSPGTLVMLQASAIGTANSTTPVSSETAVSTLSPPLLLPELPIRVYIQIADESQRPVGKALIEKLRNAGILAPGIELVSRGIPTQPDLRYCEDKVDSNTLQKVQAAIKGLVTPDPVPLMLNKGLCTKVRVNHLELWLSRP